MTASLLSSESNEWYTPPSVYQPIQAFLGGFDLDPAADPGCRLPASVHFTKNDDALSRRWFGRVFLNPPFGKLTQRYVPKAVAEYESGRVPEMILLVGARTDTRWFAQLFAYPMVFKTGRIKFIPGDGDPDRNSPTVPNVLVYFGQREREFIETFGSWGAALRRAK